MTTITRSTRTHFARFRTLAMIAGVCLVGSFARAQEVNDGARPVKPPVGETPAAKATEPKAYVVLTTSKGKIAVELDRERAPISVENFMKYVEDGYYDGTVFHRVIAGFMIQGGGYTEDIELKPGLREPIKNEWQNGLKNKRGTIAMARLGGRADSATSQFFINVADNDFLDQPRDGAGYAVFGKVVAGMKVVDEIRAVPTGHKSGMSDVPNETVAITGAKSVSKDDVEKMIEAEKPATVPATPITPPADGPPPPRKGGE